MLGAIAGDIIGSVYEAQPIKTKHFPLFQAASRFTDDTVLTVAVAHAILTGTPYRDSIQAFGRRFPRAGYGGSFMAWLATMDPEPYGSWGNGSAMRVSPVGFAFNTVEDVLREAASTAVISHDHPEGIKGAQAVALAVYLARQDRMKAARDRPEQDPMEQDPMEQDTPEHYAVTDPVRERIRRELAGRFGYNMARTVDSIRPGYRFDVSCQGSVPEAIIAFLDSTSFEDAVRNAVSLGGDSDTLACMAGAVAEAYYGGVPDAIHHEVRARLPDDLWDVVEAFYEAMM